MSIIGEPLDYYVDKQIKIRQEKMGKISNRDEEMLVWANSKTSWIKLASGVSLSGSFAEERLKGIGLDPQTYIGEKLAQEYVLFGGTSKLTNTGDEYNTLTQRSKFSEVYNHTDTDFGLVPMPGIESATIQDKGVGALKEATVEIVANSRMQMEILDILYLRLGYVVLLEWGNSHYMDNAGNFKEMQGTLIERNTIVSNNPSIFNFFNNPKPKFRRLYEKIGHIRKKYSGNYDGFVAKVVNFDWSFQPDGTYKITLKLISLGDVMESFKINTSPTTAYGSTPDSTSNVNFVEEEFNKWVSINSVTGNTSGDYIKVETLSGGYKNQKNVGWFVTPSLELEFVEGKSAPGVGGIVGEELLIINDDTPDLYELKTALYNRSPKLWDALISEGLVTYTEGVFLDSLLGDYKGTNYVTSINKVEQSDQDALEGFRKPIDAGSWWNDDVYFKLTIIPGTLTITSDLADNPVIYLSTVHETWNTNDQRANYANYYMRFSSLLELINENLPSTNLTIPTISKKNIYGKRLPNQMSFDPRICIVNHQLYYDKDDPSKYLNNYADLKYFQTKIGGEPVGNFSNVYLSFATIKESMDSNLSEGGDVNLQTLLEDICGKINKSMGGINNIQPTLDEKTNEIVIFDSSLPSNKINKACTQLQIYGYGFSPSGSISNFVRNVGLKTEISPEFASMVTIGSTASGYSKGMEATAFSKWNKGIFDRFKGNNNMGESTSTPPSSSIPEPEVNYLTYLTGLSGSLNYLGFDETANWHSFNTTIIDTNVTVNTEFFKYLRAKTYEKDPVNYTSTSNGFIPFNLQLTLDGISGIKIWNKIEVDSRFLPSNYPENLKFVVKRVSHKLSNGDWETSIDTTVMPGSYSPNP